MIKAPAMVFESQHDVLPAFDAGGYSGKAVKPIALRFIQQLRMHPELRDFPISGIGGIETWEDAA
ncbi:hypothetical protein ONR49_25265, partial [Salmonella enterica subsp. enterica serovar Virginia]|nr:hypothetical protein [Salmonella enterica subsp. enterica serovar Virginia]